MSAGRTLWNLRKLSGVVRRFREVRPWGLRCGGHSGPYLSMVTSGGRGRSRDYRQPPLLTLVGAAAFAFFSKPTEEDEEGLSDSEKTIVYQLKKAKLSIMKGEVDEAEEILHKTLHLAVECESKRAIIYTYDLMANLAFLRGQYDNAEKLYKTTMVHMLESGVKQDENSFLEISLKLASIYASLNQNDMAVAGFQFCILSLEERTVKEKDLPQDILSDEEKTNTRLLLGLCLDSYGRYLVTRSQLLHAQTMYEKALRICREEQGELHPQTVTLLNDLATVLEAQGRYDEAYTTVRQALHLAEKSGHPDHHVILGNMATILMHQGGTENLVDAERIFMEALSKAEEKKDTVSAQYIQKGLSELETWKKEQVQKSK